MKPDQIIEHFLEALRHDPNAPAPPYMREETAAFLRDLVRAESAVPSSSQRARIWQRALSAAQRAESETALQGEKEMFHVEPLRAKRTLHYSWTAAAAMVAVVLMIAAVLMGNLPPSNSSAFGSAQSSTATATVTASATFVPSATPLIGTPCPTMAAPFITPTATPLFITPPANPLWTATPIGGTPSDCVELIHAELLAPTMVSSTAVIVVVPPTIMPALALTATPMAAETSAQIESVRQDSEQEAFVITIATQNSAKIARYRLEVALVNDGYLRLIGIFFFDAPPHELIKVPYAALPSSSIGDRPLRFVLYGLNAQDDVITASSSDLHDKPLSQTP